jgi:hypothetical protein
MSIVADQDVDRVAGDLSLLVEADQVVELRLLNCTRGRNGTPHTEAAFFKGDLKKLAWWALFLTGKSMGVYITLNPLREEILQRPRGSGVVCAAGEGELAHNNDVAARRCLVIDIDRSENRKLPATDAERERVWKTVESVREFTRSLGWPDPAILDTGNGYHLIYQVDLPVNDGGVVQRAVMAIKAACEDEHSEIDLGPTRPLVMTRVPGTVNRKGKASKDRPHRVVKYADRGAGGAVPAEFVAALADTVVIEPPDSPPQTSYAPPVELDRHVIVERAQKYLAKYPKAKSGDHGHDRTFGAACVLVIDFGLSEDEALFAIQGWNQECDPPWSEKDLRRKIHEATKKPGERGRLLKQQCICFPRPAASPKVLPTPPANGYASHPQGAHGQGSVNSPGGGQAAGIAQQQLPTIVVNNRHFREVADDALAALAPGSAPPTVFRNGGLLARVRREDGLQLEVLTEDSLGGILARLANWYNRTAKGNAPSVNTPVPPPLRVIKDLLSLPSYPGIPVIRSVVECPVFDRKGNLVATPGYNAESQIWYEPSPDLNLPDLPEVPTEEQIHTARNLLLDDLLVDFPFTDEASRAHAVAALLSPIVREMVDGPIPLTLYDAPSEGTGKNLLAEVTGIVTTGKSPPPLTESSSDEEWRKRITSVLASAPTIILLDNLNRYLDTGALAAVLASRSWTDRLLGSSRIITLPNNAIWLATGNNVRLSRELIRRTLWCRLDAKTEEPWERSDFKHLDLSSWVTENRGRLVWAVLVLCRAWIAAGRPPGKERLGGFDRYAAVIGGILAIAAVPGFLTNAKQFRLNRLEKDSEWKAFCVSWWADYEDQKIGVKELYNIATTQGLLDSVLGDKGERSQRTNLGNALKKIVGRVFDKYMVEDVGEDHRKCSQYRLTKQSNAEADTPSVTSPTVVGGLDLNL